MKQIGIGVIGLGRMGQVYANHVASQIEQARLVAISDANTDTLQSYAQKLPGIKTYPAYPDLLADRDVNAVIIATPTSTHRDLVIAAAQAGKAIFCEKPTSLTLPDTDAMIAAVEQAGVLLQVGFMRRFDKGYEAARQQIESGAIGTPVTVRSISRDPFRTSLEYADPNKSGGLMIDMGIHDVDITQWLLQDRIERVYTEAGVLVYPELATVGDVDNAMVTARFRGGALGNLEASRNAVYGYDIQCEILGSAGALRVGYLQQTPMLVLNKQGVHHDVVPHFPQRFGAAYTTQIEHFVDCVLNDQPARVTAQDARSALQVCIAATISQHEGRVVRVDEVQ